MSLDPSTAPTSADAADAGFRAEARRRLGALERRVATAVVQAVEAAAAAGASAATAASAASSAATAAASAAAVAQAELDANRAATWQTPSLAAGYSNGSAPRAPAAYYQDTFGRVYTRGTVLVPEGASSGDVLFTYATGYRPVYEHEFALITGAFEGSPISARGVVQTDGDLVLNFVGAFESLPLDIIEFRTI